jgi:hypothetical protein
MAPMRPAPAAPLLALLTAAAALALVSCGGGDDSDAGGSPEMPTSTSLPRPDRPPEIPELPDNDDPARVRCTGPPRGLFDATAIVGGSLSEAEAAAEAEGCSVREVIRDGEGLAVTDDFRPDRVNVATRAGRVSRIVSLG